MLHERPLLDDSSNFSFRVQGIEKALQMTNSKYSLEFVDKKNQSELYLPFKLTKGSNYDGVILLGRFSQKYAGFISSKIPNLIFYTGYSPAYDYDSVWFNFNNCGYKQCEYLIKNNHKNIAFLGNMNIFKNKEILSGIITALEDHELGVNNSFFINSNDNYKEILLKLFSIKSKSKPSAVICETDSCALELVKILHDINIEVPKDVSIIGTGDSQFSTFSIPSLTTVDLNIEYSCEAAVELLLKKINYINKPKENIGIYGFLVERDSVRRLD